MCSMEQEAHWRWERAGMMRLWMDGEGDGQRDGEGKATLQIVV
jgi:hypothetical protein